MDVFKHAAIDKGKHHKVLQERANVWEGNPMPKGIVSLEKLFDLKNWFKGQPKTKTQSSTLLQEKINLEMKEDPNFFNLNTCCSLEEIWAFIQLFKQYWDVFACTCDDLKTCDMRIIQHVIPVKDGVKPF